MGYGDEIMTTATVREMRAAHPHARLLVGDGLREYWSVIFDNNPHLSRLADVAPHEETIWIEDYMGHRPQYLKLAAEGNTFNPDFHARPGEIYFSPEEEATAARLTAGLGPFVVIEPHVKGTVSGSNKDWGFDRWQRLVLALGSEILFVQPGPAGTRTLIGARHVETPDFRTACAVLARARAIATSEGGLHHAAAAVGTPGVVIFGGYISPSLTGYELHTNFYVDDKESPCGRHRPCRHCMRCMQAITVDQVAAALRVHLQQEKPA
jgi:ADP-heptose:LPS heptosyltransferase